MKCICSVASDYLGVPDKDCEVTPDRLASEACLENYYTQKGDDPDHPSKLPKVCGNCLHWVVVEG